MTQASPIPEEVLTVCVRPEIILRQDISEDLIDDEIAWGRRSPSPPYLLRVHAVTSARHRRNGVLAGELDDERLSREHQRCN